MPSKPHAKRTRKRPRGAPMSALRALAEKRGAPPGHPQQDKLREPRNRWQRFVRYVWDRKRG